MDSRGTSTSSAPLKKTWSRGIEILETVNDIELGQKGGSVNVDKIMEVSQDIVVKGDLMVMGWVRVEGRMNKDPEEWIEAGGKGPTDTEPMYIKTQLGTGADTPFNPACFAIKNQKFEQGFRSLSKDGTVVVKGDLVVKGNLAVFGNVRVEGECLFRAITDVYLGDTVLLKS